MTPSQTAERAVLRMLALGVHLRALASLRVQARLAITCRRGAAWNARSTVTVQCAHRNQAVVGAKVRGLAFQGVRANTARTVVSLFPMVTGAIFVRVQWMRIEFMWTQWLRRCLISAAFMEIVTQTHLNAVASRDLGVQTALGLVLGGLARLAITTVPAALTGLVTATVGTTEMLVMRWAVPKYAVSIPLSVTVEKTARNHVVVCIRGSVVVHGVINKRNASA